MGQSSDRGGGAVSTSSVALLLEKKFILHAVAQVTSTGLIAFGAIDGAQWTGLNMVILSAFTLGSVVESVAGRDTTTGKSP